MTLTGLNSADVQSKRRRLTVWSLGAASLALVASVPGVTSSFALQWQAKLGWIAVLVFGCTLLIAIFDVLRERSEASYERKLVLDSLLLPPRSAAEVEPGDLGLDATKTVPCRTGSAMPCGRDE